MLRNNTKKILLAKEIVWCKSHLQKAKGLMFQREFSDQALIFPFKSVRKISLHMYFVRFPIDVILCDEKKKIIELKELFLPWTFYNSKYKAKYCIEVPQNTIIASQTQLNDQLEF